MRRSFEGQSDRLLGNNTVSFGTLPFRIHIYNLPFPGSDSFSLKEFPSGK